MISTKRSLISKRKRPEKVVRTNVFLDNFGVSTDYTSLQNHTPEPWNDLGLSYTQFPSGDGTTADIKAQDFFTDTNGTLLTAHTIAPINIGGGSWTKYTRAGSYTGDIQSNRARHLQQNTGAGGTGFHWIDKGVADVTITCTMQANHADQVMDIIFRGVDDTHWLNVSLYIGGNSVRLIQDNAGVTVLASGAFTLAINTDYYVRVLAIGSLIKVFVNGTEVISHTTTFNQTATRVGFGCLNVVQNGSGQFENFRVAEGTLGPFEIVSSKATCLGTAVANLATLDGALLAADANAEVIVCPVGESKVCGLRFRVQDDNNYLLLGIDPADTPANAVVSIYKVEAGVRSTIAGPVSIADSEAAELERCYLLRANYIDNEVVCGCFGYGVHAFIKATTTFNQAKKGIGFYAEGEGTYFHALKYESLADHSTMAKGLVCELLMDESVITENDASSRHDSSIADWNNRVDAISDGSGPPKSSTFTGGGKCMAIETAKKQYLLLDPQRQFGFSQGTHSYTEEIDVELSSTVDSPQGIVSQEDGDLGGRLRAERIDYVTGMFRKVLFRANGDTIAIAEGPDAPVANVRYRLHVVVDMDADTVTLYMNGIAGTPANFAEVPLRSQTIPYRFGAFINQTTGYFGLNGKLGPYRRWARVLTAAEIAERCSKGHDAPVSPKGNKYLRNGLVCTVTLPVSYLAGAARGVDLWDSLPGGFTIPYWADVDSDNVKELVAVGVGRKPLMHVWKRGGKLLRSNIANIAVAQAKAAYYTKVDTGSNKIFYPDTGTDLVTAFDIADCSIDWTYDTGTKELMNIELTSQGLAIGSHPGASGQLDIVSYTTGLSIGGNYPVAVNCWEQSLNSAIMNGVEKIWHNNFVADPGDITIRQYAANGTEDWNLASEASNVDAYRCGPIKGDGNDYVVFSFTPDGTGYVFDGDRITCRNSAGVEQWQYDFDGVAPFFEVGDFVSSDPDLKIAFNVESSEVSSGLPKVGLINGADGTLLCQRVIAYLFGGGGQIALGAYRGANLQIAINTGDGRGDLRKHIVGWEIWQKRSSANVMEFVNRWRGDGWNLSAAMSPANRSGSIGFFSAQDEDGDGIPEVAGSHASIMDTGYDYVTHVRPMVGIAE